MVDKFNEIAVIIENEKGRLSLFAVMKMDEYADKWSVVVSATWINDQNRNEIFK